VIIPPSILMIVWGGLMSVSNGGLFLAGVLPGILIALSMMATVYVYARIYGYPIYARSSLRGLATAFGQAILALMTPLIIIGGIVGGFFTPTEASVIAVLYSLILGLFVYRSITPGALPRCSTTRPASPRSLYFASAPRPPSAGRSLTSRSRALWSPRSRPWGWASTAPASWSRWRS
jgi:TRAP-type C4-dicarboxylate transport system permease large subunit